jgi:hypothetical protein
MKPNGYFLHIAKTGGTSVHQLITDSNINIQTLHVNYNEKFKKFESEIHKNIKLLSTTKLPIFVLFRNPMDQFLSSYYFFRIYDYIKLQFDNNYTFENYIHSDKCNNQQVNFFLNKFFLDETFPTNLEFQKLLLFLQKPNVHFNTLENIDSFIMTIDKVMNTNMYNVYQTHKYKKRYNKFQLETYMIPDTFNEIIKEKLNYDIKLYNFCLQHQKDVRKINICNNILKKKYELTYPWILFTNEKKWIEKNLSILKEIKIELELKDIINNNDYCYHWINLLFQKLNLKSECDLKEFPQKHIANYFMNTMCLNDEFYYLKINLL